MPTEPNIHGQNDYSELIEKITHGSPNDDGSYRAFHAACLAEVQLPCDAFVIGEPVSVTRLKYDGNARRGLTAICRREDGSEHVVAACDVLLAERAMGAHILAAYRQWLGLSQLVAFSQADGRLQRRHKANPDELVISSTIKLVVLSQKGKATRCQLAGTDRIITFRNSGYELAVPGEIIEVRPKKQWKYSGHPYLSGYIESVKFDAPALGLVPLRLEDGGEWNPHEHYWGEEDEPIEDWAKPIIACGPRPTFEMEQVLPGQDPEDYHSDPIYEAIELRDAGNFGKAIDRLMSLCQSDLRCLDAHAHLGNFAIDLNVGEAIRHYAVGVGIGELSLGSDFSGLLPWGRINNRPFLRCLHGFGLCAWRLERFDEAEGVFTRMLWLNPTDNLGVRLVLDEVKTHQEWKPDQDDLQKRPTPDAFEPGLDIDGSPSSGN